MLDTQPDRIVWPNSAPSEIVRHLIGAAVEIFVGDLRGTVNERNGRRRLLCLLLEELLDRETRRRLSVCLVPFDEQLLLFEWCQVLQAVQFLPWVGHYAF